MFSLSVAGFRGISLALAAMSLLALLSPLESRAACDAETLRRIADQAARTDEELLHFAVFPGQVSDARLVRVAPGKSGTVTVQQASDILAQVANGRAQVHFNPNNPGQIWVRVDGETGFYVFNRTTEVKVAGNQPFDEVVFSYGGKKGDVPPGMKYVYPELITGAENARALGRLETLSEQTSKLQLPTQIGRKNMAEFESMSNEQLARFIKENRSVPFIPDSKTGVVAKYQCGTATCVDDAFGNVWRSGPSRTKGEDFEWDVTLKDKNSWLAQAARDAGFLHQGRNGSVYVNVSLSGRISH
jgi:hypothetical protein